MLFRSLKLDLIDLTLRVVIVSAIKRMKGVKRDVRITKTREVGWV